MKDNKKVVVITGGSDGLGLAITKLLLDDYRVMVISKRYGEKTSEIECDELECDVTDSNKVYESIEQVIEHYGKIDVLINNAGVWLAGDPSENTYEEISNCIDVNTKGPIYMTKAVLPYMYKQKSGLIINVCSQASFDSDDFSSVYTASKWAMRGFNRAIQKQVAKNNIKVTGFYPGFMQTDIFKKAGNDYDTSTGLEVEKVAKAIKYIIECDDDVMIPEFGIRDIENY